MEKHISNFLKEHVRICEQSECTDENGLPDNREHVAGAIALLAELEGLGMLPPTITDFNNGPTWGLEYNEWEPEDE